ncbi:MAG: hypothetical protein II800_06220 [Lachnospiraceae bacterium]|nr:hypothetical protein [Lachnospiraceae bacterium]
MSFELWLFAMKNLGQTPDAAKMVYDNMPAEEQQRLKEEYDSTSAS